MALIRDYRVVWEAAVGLADREEGKKATAETLFQAGSISKPVTAAALLREAQKGTFRLDVDVNDYLKSWKLPANELTAREKVTLERILSHGAGLTVHGFPGYAAGEAVPTVPQVLDGAPPANTAPVRVDLVPGSRWRYSGGGYTIAQLAMSDTLGQAFPDLMRTLCLAPAGMSLSTYEQPLPASRLGRGGGRLSGRRLARRREAARVSRDGGGRPVDDGGGPGPLRDRDPEVPARRRGEPAVPADRGADGDAVHRGVRPRLRRRDARERALLQPRRRGRRLPGLPRGPPRRLGRRGHGQLGQRRRSRGRDPPRPRAAGRLEGLPPRAARARRPVRRRSAGASGTLPGERRRGPHRRVARRPRLRSRLGRPRVRALPVEGDRLARKDREIRYGVLRADGGVRALAIENDDGRSEAPRMAPGETIPFDHVAGGTARGGDERLPGPPGGQARRPAASRSLASTASATSWRDDRSVQAALIVLQVNTGLYPDSANTWDSLGEVLLRDGQRARALECYRKVLEVLPRDKKATKRRRASSVPTPSARSASCRPSRGQAHPARKRGFSPPCPTPPIAFAASAISTRPAASSFPTPGTSAAPRVLAGPRLSRPRLDQLRVRVVVGAARRAVVDGRRRCAHFRALAEGVPVPVERGLPGRLRHRAGRGRRNVAAAVRTGLAGISIEDSTGIPGSPLFDFPLAVERIRAARRAIDESGTGVLLTGRSEGFIAGRPDLGETIRRLLAYPEAGAECLYAPGIAPGRTCSRS